MSPRSSINRKDSADPLLDPSVASKCPQDEEAVDTTSLVAELGSKYLPPAQHVEHVRKQHSAIVEKTTAKVCAVSKLLLKAQMPIADLLKECEADPKTGLTSAEVEARKQKYGPNEIEKAKTKSLWRICLEQVNVLNFLVFMAGVLCFVQGFTIPGTEFQFGDDPDIFNGCLLFAIVFLCAGVGAGMEWKCSQIMTDLSSKTSSQCNVVRNGEEMVVETADIVPGDIVMIKAGDTIPADARIIECCNLMTDEALLTGESHEMVKTVEVEDAASPFPSNLVYSMTNVTSGTGKIVVVWTGMSSQVGIISESLKSTDVGLTPVQKTMNQIGFLITCACAFLVGSIFVVSFWGRVNDPADPCRESDTNCFLVKSMMRSLFSAVGAIPETLQPAALFLLVMGCKQLATINATTKKLSAVDSIGACTVICSDKTGTLTEGRMAAERFVCPVRGMENDKYQVYPVRGLNPNGGIFKSLDKDQMQKMDQTLLDGSNRFGDIATNYGNPGTENADNLRIAAMACYINCHGTQIVFDAETNSWNAKGNSSEAALVVAAAKAQITGDAPFEKYPRNEQGEVPFSSARKMAATVHKLTDSKFESLQFDSNITHIAIIKGAPDFLMSKLAKVLVKKGSVVSLDTEPITSEEKARMAAANEEMSSQALRVLLVAGCPLTAEQVQEIEQMDAEDRMDALLSNLFLISLMGLRDPPRPEAARAVLKAKAAGVRVCMITGDQISTAKAIAKQIHISCKKNDARYCSELHDPESGDALPEEEIDAIVDQTMVWARATPADKILIVESFQRMGHVPVMTGDGVNDAGALKKADIGIAMGITGSEVTKGVADVVLDDDNFATIVAATQEGRRIFSNIQKMVCYLICVNLFEVIVILIAMIMGWPVPIEEEQLLYANFITHEFYPWVMLFQPAEKISMKLPPRDRKKGVIGKLTWLMLIIPTLFLYSGTLLTAQYCAGNWFSGITKLEHLMGTDNVELFHNVGNLDDYACFHAGSMVNDEFVKDVEPIHCKLQIKDNMFSDRRTVEQWGNLLKPEEYSDIKDFDSSTGEFGEFFAKNNSPWAAWNFKPNADGKFVDPSGYLQECTEDDNGELVKHLCWVDAKKEKPVLYDDANIMAFSVRRVRSVIVSTMVLMEFGLLFSFSKYEFSLINFFDNSLFFYFWPPMALVLLTYIYFPVNVWDGFGYSPINFLTLVFVIVLAACFFFAFEGLKVMYRHSQDEKYEKKKVVASLAASGDLKAYTRLRDVDPIAIEKRNQMMCKDQL